MNAAVVMWVIVAVVLGVVEAATVNLVTIWSAIAAICAAFCATFEFSGLVQFSVFVIVSGILLLLTRPLANKLLNSKAVPTNADRVIGTEGTVTERIDPIENKGQVKVMGQIWTAKSEDGGIIEKGSIVTVSAIEGVRAVVSLRGEGGGKTESREYSSANSEL